MIGGNIWLGDMSAPPPGPRVTELSQREDILSRIRDLEYDIGRLKLLNQALWELLKEKVKVSEAELEKRISDIDLRDGVADGRITDVALKCPTCGRISSSKHWKCLYCGQEFEKPVMG